MTGLRQFFIEPLATPSSNGIWFLIQVLPLLLPMPGALRGELRSMFMLSSYTQRAQLLTQTVE